MKKCQDCTYRENEKCKLTGKYAEPNHIYQDSNRKCPLNRYEMDCKYPFYVSEKHVLYGSKGCEVDLLSGEKLTYMPIPDSVRNAFASITRFYKSEDGQQLIENRLIKD